MRFLNWKNQHTRRDLFVFGSWRDRDIRHFLSILVFVAILAGAVGLFFTGVPFTNTAYCGQICHAVNPQYQTWVRSSHANVACHYCHRDNSYIGVSKERFTEPVKRYLKMTSDKPGELINVNSEYSQEKVPDEWCRGCHSSIIRRIFSRNTLKIEEEMHTKHSNAGLRCTTCHNRIAHPNAGEYVDARKGRPDFKYKDFMTMREGCWRCHSQDVKYLDQETLALVKGKKAPAACDVCHNSNSDLKPSSGLLAHSEVDGIPWKDGRRRHGKIAKLDFGVCFACHKKESVGQARENIPDCSSSCHGGTTMPHNTPAWAKYYEDDPAIASWTEAHPDAASLRGVSLTGDWGAKDPGSACSICHNKTGVSANFCQGCHHQEFSIAKSQPQTAWGSQHSSVVKDVGSGGCHSCHQIDFCVSCHLSGKEALRAGR